MSKDLTEEELSAIEALDIQSLDDDLKAAELEAMNATTTAGDDSTAYSASTNEEVELPNVIHKEGSSYQSIYLEEKPSQDEVHGDRIEFNVDPLDIEDMDPTMKTLMARDEDADESFALQIKDPHLIPLFPPPIRMKGHRPSFVRISAYNMSFRVRRLLLEDEIRSIQDKLQEYLDLEALCHKKKAAHRSRLLMLEEEFDYIAEDVMNKSDCKKKVGPMSAWLTTRDGWKMFTETLHKEYKRVQLEEAKEADAIRDQGEDGEGEDDAEGKDDADNDNASKNSKNSKNSKKDGEEEDTDELEEHIDYHLTSDICEDVWELVQYFQLFNSIKSRCRLGPNKYPVRVRQDAKPDKACIVKGDLEAIDNKFFMPPATSPMMSPVAIHKGSPTDLKKLQDASNLGQAAEGDAMSQFSGDYPNIDDQSTIISTSTMAQPNNTVVQYDINGDVIEATNDNSVAGSASPQHVAFVDQQAVQNASVASKGSSKKSSKKDKKFKKKEAEKTPEKEEKKSGGWGFGSLMGAMTSMFTGKKEEVEEEEFPCTLKPFIPSGNGQAVGAWMDVCFSLGSEPGDVSLKSACKSVLSILEYHAAIEPESKLGQSFSRSERNDLVTGITEMLDDDVTSTWVEANMTSLTNHIAEHIKEMFIEALRAQDKFLGILEQLRKDRIKKSGGTLSASMDNDGQVEVDKQGTIRVIPNADDIVDTDIVHGSRQRLRIAVVMPALKKKKVEVTTELYEKKGLLAVLVQFGFILIVPYVQRAMRGFIGRVKRNTNRKDLALYAMHSAATTLQTWVRAIQGRKAFKEKKAEMMDAAYDIMVVHLQSAVRMLVKAGPYNRWWKKKKDDSEWFAITSFQAMIRGFNARRRYVKLKTKVYAEREQETQNYSVDLIQRVARGYIARKTIVKSLKVRNTISKDVLLKAERYLSDGDLWSFLKDIDDEVKILKKTIQDNQKEEDDLASTFIDKVIRARQGEFDDAWNKFDSAMNKGKSTSLLPDGSGSVASPAKSKASCMKSMNGDTNKSQGAETEGMRATTPGGSQVPGPLLRRVTTADSRATSRGGNLQEDAKSTNNKSGKKTGKGLGKSTKSKKPPPPRGGGSRRGKKMTDAEKRELSGIYNTTTDYAWAAATGTLAQEEETLEEKRKPHPGEAVLVDCPKGLDDTIERMVHVASMKCYIPEFCNVETHEEAYELYKALPSGLAKIRYEVEANRWCQARINQLRVKGIVKIRDGLPTNKLRQYMNSVDMPLEVTGMVVKWVKLLQQMGDMPAGKVHKDTADRMKDLKSGKGSVQQLKKIAVRAAVAEGEEEDAAEEGGGNGSPQPATDSSPTTKSITSPIKKKKKASTYELPKKEVDPELEAMKEKIRRDLLNDFVSDGQWASLTARVDELMTNAAYMIVEHVKRWKDYRGIVQEETTPMGHKSFDTHVRDLQKCEDSSERKEKVRERFRAALLLATPYILRMQGDNVRTVQDLIMKPELLKQLKLPPMYFTQCEAFLAVAIGNSAQGKIAPTVHEHVKEAKEVFAVPMMFDPKFQRNPFDPYGQPPRYIPPLPTDDKLLKKTKLYKSTKKSIKDNKKKLSSIKDADISKLSPDSKKVKEIADLDLGQMANSLFSNIEEEEKPSPSKITEIMYRPEVRKAEDRPIVERKPEPVEIKWEKSTKRKESILKEDFETRVRNGFDRPFKCTEPGCTAAFSRAYTLKVHMKSHKVFSTYHKWKKDPQLILDPNRKTMEEEAKELVESRSKLPAIVMGDLEKLEEQVTLSRLNSAAENMRNNLDTISIDDSNYSGESFEQYQDNEEAFEEEKNLQEMLDACQWPERGEAAASKAVRDIPSRDSEMYIAEMNSRPITPMFQPSTNPSRAISRGGPSQGSSRAQSPMDFRAQSPINMGSRPHTSSLSRPGTSNSATYMSMRAQSPVRPGSQAGGRVNMRRVTPN